MNNPLFRNALVTLASFIFVITIVSAWTAPTQTAPNGNVSAPITVGASNQIKAGGLGVASLTTTGGASIGTNAGADQLCLNGSCITAWPVGGVGPQGPAGPAGPVDNLGNHTATQNINMSGAQVTSLGTPVNVADAATKGYVDGKFVNRTWANLKGTRSVNTNYTNNTGHDIEVAAGTYSGASFKRCSVALTVDAVVVGSEFINNTTGASVCTASATVPNGALYKVSNVMSPEAVAGENLLWYWSELR